jgi:heme exporter protein D
MVWNSLGEFFHMGGYGLYVWGSVIVTFCLMLTEVFILRLRRQAIMDHLGHARELEQEIEGEEDGGRV